jgi:FlgN protein
MDAAEDLSHQLWTMRELLQHLVFKLEVQGMLMSTSRTRWVPFAAAEVDAILEAIDEVEHLRAAASRRLEAQNGFPGDIRLTDLIDRLGQPWGPLLAQHRLHLLSLQAEIEDMSRANHEMARRGLMRSREVIAAMGESAVDVYDPHGASVSLVSASQRLDRTF